MTSAAVVMVSNRPDQLSVFLRSLAVRYGSTYPVYVHLQGAAQRHVDVPRTLVDVIRWQISPSPLGCHAARVFALRQMHDDGLRPEAYINVDDDVTLLRSTKWEPAIERATTEPGAGFVLTNWVRHPNHIRKAVDRATDTFVRQVMVYNGGGMAYSPEVAALMRDLDPVPARYDDMWPLTAYLHGYQSYRYLGSVTLHRIMGKGGMSDYMRAEPRPLLGWEWVDYRPLSGAKVGSEYSIPADNDLRPVAHEVHRAARKERGWC